MYHLDLDGDGHPDLLAHDPDGGWLLVWRRWPDGSVRSQNLRQAAAELLGLEGTPWELVALTFHPQDEMVSIRSAARPVPDPPHPPPVSAAGGRLRPGISCWPPPASREKILSLSVILFHLGPMRCSGRDWTWTGQGEPDDSVTVFSYDDDSASGPLTWWRPPWAPERC